MRCPRCGKNKHDGQCSFDLTKKSMIEEQSDKVVSLKATTDELKKTKV